MKQQKNFLKKIPRDLFGVLIVLAIGFYFNYVDASIHVWGTILGIWIIITLYEVVDLKKKIKQK